MNFVILPLDPKVHFLLEKVWLSEIFSKAHLLNTLYYNYLPYLDEPDPNYWHESNHHRIIDNFLTEAIISLASEDVDNRYIDYVYEFVNERKYNEEIDTIVHIIYLFNCSLDVYNIREHDWIDTTLDGALVFYLHDKDFLENEKLYL